MRRVAVGFLLLTHAAPAVAITIEDLQNATLQTRVNYDMRIRRAEGVFDSRMTVVWKLRIDPEGRVFGDMTRTVTTPRGPRVQTVPLRGRIGIPGTPATGGDGIWLLESDKLVALRAFESGGMKIEVEFSGTAPDFKCVIRAPFLREEGKEIRATGPAGVPVTVLNATQKSSDCRLTR